MNYLMKNQIKDLKKIIDKYKQEKVVSNLFQKNILWTKKNITKTPYIMKKSTGICPCFFDVCKTIAFYLYQYIAT